MKKFNLLTRSQLLDKEVLNFCIYQYHLFLGTDVFGVFLIHYWKLVHALEGSKGAEAFDHRRKALKLPEGLLVPLKMVSRYRILTLLSHSKALVRRQLSFQRKFADRFFTPRWHSEIKSLMAVIRDVDHDLDNSEEENVWCAKELPLIAKK